MEHNLTTEEEGMLTFYFDLWVYLKLPIRLQDHALLISADLTRKGYLTLVDGEFYLTDKANLWKRTKEVTS